MHLATLWAHLVTLFVALRGDEKMQNAVAVAALAVAAVGKQGPDLTFADLTETEAYTAAFVIEHAMVTLGWKIADLEVRIDTASKADMTECLTRGIALARKNGIGVGWLDDTAAPTIRAHAPMALVNSTGSREKN